MDQQLRHQYLEAMGIDSWLPRQQLAAARPTPDWVWDFCWEEEGQAPKSGKPSQTAEPIASSAEVAAAAKQARAALSASFGEASTNKSTKAPAKPVAQPVSEASPEVSPETVNVTSVPAVETTSHQAIEPVEIEMPTPEKSSEQAPFKLAFMSYGDCLVVDSLPPQSRQTAAQADAHHQILLDKILRSITLQGGSCIGYYTLPWPMFASRSLDQGAEQARRTVQHKLNKTLQQQPVKTVLLLGEAAAQMVLERDESLEQLRGMLFSLRSDVKTLASASLTEMMTLPGCKRDVWRDLQPLLDHLEQQV